MVKLCILFSSHMSDPNKVLVLKSSGPIIWNALYILLFLLKHFKQTSQETLLYAAAAQLELLVTVIVYQRYFF